jgi:hypothetical protein
MKMKRKLKVFFLLVLVFYLSMNLYLRQYLYEDLGFVKNFDNLAKEYMEIDNVYFKECDAFDGYEFVFINDIFCKNSNNLCKNSSIDVIYSLTVNMVDLIRIFNLKEEQTICKVDALDQPEKLVEKRKTEYFLKQNNYTIYTDLYGLYKVICTKFIKNVYTLIYKDFYYIFPNRMSELERLSSTQDLSESTSFKKMNAFIIKIDSLSYLHFQRVMPITFEYLTNKLDNNIVFNNLNSIGENTFPNLVPLLTGFVVESINSLNLKSEVYSAVNQDEGYYDKLPFIWYEYEKYGYITGYHVN